jgi:hypothetical protein
VGIFKIGSLVLLPRSSFKPWSSWSLPPGWVGLQAQPTGAQCLKTCFFKTRLHYVAWASGWEFCILSHFPVCWDYRCVPLCLIPYLVFHINDFGIYLCVYTYMTIYMFE